MYCVWRSYLEGTVQATQTRIGACESYKVQVADPVKTVRLQKDQQLRKVHRKKKNTYVGGHDNSQKLKTQCKLH